MVSKNSERREGEKKQKMTFILICEAWKDVHTHSILPATAISYLIKLFRWCFAVLVFYGCSSPLAPDTSSSARGPLRRAVNQNTELSLLSALRNEKPIPRSKLTSDFQDWPQNPYPQEQNTLTAASTVFADIHNGVSKSRKDL